MSAAGCRRSAWAWPSGSGLNAKYAMAYFVACAGLFLVTTPARRRLLRDTRLYGALGIAAPADCAQCHLECAQCLRHDRAYRRQRQLGPLAVPSRQDGGVLPGAVRRVRPHLLCRPAVERLAGMAGATRRSDRLLLWLSLPDHRGHHGAGVPVARACQLGGDSLCARRPFSSCAQLLRWSDGARWLRGSIVLHGAVAGCLGGQDWRALARVQLPIKNDPLARLLGWKDLGQAIGKELEAARLAQRPIVPS